MKTNILLSALSGIAAISAIQSCSQPTRPNVVLIISDDMGYADMPRFGKNMEIPMPQMERLCREGITLTDAYVSGPISVPSRMGIVTGRHQARWGTYTNVYDRSPFDQFQREKTIAEYFKESGYATGLFGKWHLSGSREISMNPGYRPDDKGFDEITIIPGGMSGFFPGARLYHKGGTFSEAPEYLTDHFGKLSADFIRRKKRDPFFLMLAFNAVHAPLHALDKDISQFGSLDNYDQNRYVPDLKPENREPKMDRQVYAGMMRGLDRNIGRVLDALDSAGIADNTLVFFINDNGGPSLDAAVHSYNQSSNNPYRGHKFDCLEGGIRVPMAIRWPNKLTAGKIFSGIVSGMDILPTALSASGIPLPKEKKLDGVNLLPFINGSRSGNPHESLCWQIYFGDEKTSGQAAIRQGKWKLHQNAPVSTGPISGQWALYDLSADPGEVNDLAIQHPEMVIELDAAWWRWKKQMQSFILPPAK